MSPDGTQVAYSAWQAGGWRDLYLLDTQSGAVTALTHDRAIDCLRHAGYAFGWKKFEPLWDAVIRAKRIAVMLPLLEGILSGFAARPNGSSSTNISAK